MLLEKSWKIDDICTLQLARGEELVAKIVDSDDTMVAIVKPLVVNISVDPQTNRVGIQMIPGFIITANPDAKLRLSLHSIVTITPTEENIKKSYLANTSSLTIPASGNQNLRF